MPQSKETILVYEPRERRNIHMPTSKETEYPKPQPQKKRNVHTTIPTRITTPKEKEYPYDNLKRKGIPVHPQKAKKNASTTAKEKEYLYIRKRDGIPVQPQNKRNTSITSKEKECPYENISL